MIYGFLRRALATTRSPAQLRWESDLGRTLTDKEWEGIYRRANITAHSAGGRETWAKLVHHWYYTPTRVHRWRPLTSDRCWWGCGGEGSLVHLLWHCPKLTRFWDQVLNKLDEIFDNELPRLPAYVLLGLPNRLTYPLGSNWGSQLAMALCAATQTILALWGSDRPPEHLSWLHRLWLLLGMEKLSLAADYPKHDIAQLWTPLVSFLSNEFRELTCPRYLRILQLSTSRRTT